MIATERLVIRDFKEKDAAGLLEYLSNPRVHCFEDEKMTSFEEAIAFMSENTKGMKRCAVCLKESDEIIGDLFYMTDPFVGDTFNVGWNFNQRYEGKGLVFEAASGLISYLFADGNARRIYGFVETDNIRSQKLCKRLGMRYEGCFKEFVSFVNNPDGSPLYEDTCVYAILKKEWDFSSENGNTTSLTEGESPSMKL